MEEKRNGVHLFMQVKKYDKRRSNKEVTIDCWASALRPAHRQWD